MQQLHQGSLPSDALPGANILRFPRGDDMTGCAGSEPEQRAQAGAAQETPLSRARIPGVVLGLLLLPATMLLMEVVRRLIEG